MPTKNKEDLLRYIRKMIESTQSGQMIWVAANPTTYSWSKPQEGRVVLQCIERREGVTNPVGQRVVRIIRHYVLQAINQTGATLLSIEGADDDALDESMGKLFQTIADTNEKRGLDFLKSILPQ